MFNFRILYCIRGTCLYYNTFRKNASTFFQILCVFLILHIFLFLCKLPDTFRTQNAAFRAASRTPRRETRFRFHGTASLPGRFPYTPGKRYIPKKMRPSRAGLSRLRQPCPAAAVPNEGYPLSSLEVKQAQLVGLRQIPQQVQGIHQVHHGLGHLGTLPEIILGHEGSVLHRFHDGVRRLIPQPFYAV